MDVSLKNATGRSAIAWSSWEMMELKGQGLHVSACLGWEKGHPAPILCTKFSGVIPSRTGMRRIALAENMILDLYDIEDTQRWVWTWQYAQQHLFQLSKGIYKCRKPFRITVSYNSSLKSAWGRIVWSFSTKMSTREDAKHKFCFWYRLFRKLSTNSLLNDKTAYHDKILTWLNLFKSNVPEDSPNITFHGYKVIFSEMTPIGSPFSRS